MCRAGRSGTIDRPVTNRIFGRKIKRLEDPALLRGKGRFIDDITIPDTLHAAFIRSPFAHARIGEIDISAAQTLPGVFGVYTLDDLLPYCVDGRMPPAPGSPLVRQVPDPFVLARDETCHVGEPVAVVLASSRHIAEDAAALVAIEYDPLPAANDCRDAAADGAPVFRSGHDGNIAADFKLAYGDADSVFETAPHVFRRDIHQYKGLGHSLECRGVLAQYQPFEGRTTVWMSTQAPHSALRKIIEFTGWQEDELRLIAPDVGGGFGPKYIFYAEEAVIPLLARITERPVKWVEDRGEYFTAAIQERDQYWDMEIAADKDGCILALRGDMIHDQGAFIPGGINLPYNAATCVPGPYVIPHFDLRVRIVHTNKVPCSPVRGAGRPQGVFAMERMVDAIADGLELDRAAVRRRNLIPADAMPYTIPLKNRDGTDTTYDTGDYPEALDAALDAIGWETFSERRKAARENGAYLGIGIANFVEPTGRGPFESAIVRIGASGRVTVITGASNQGQGNITCYAQVAAEQFGVDIEDVTVVTGETNAISAGLGAFASRQAVTAGSSIHLAAVEVRDKVRKIASSLLEAAEEDIELSGGKAVVAGTDRALTFAEIADAVAGTPGYNLPDGITPGLEAASNWMPDALTYCNGATAVEVAVDIETGNVTINRLVAVHDSGRLINPMIVDGQIVGGSVHGIGNALFEFMAWDEDANPLTTNLAEYLLPTAPEVPEIELIHRESPTPRNPIGVKGAGEGGTIPVPAAVIGAVEDALRPFNVRIDHSPLSPEGIVAAVRDGMKESNA